MSDSARVCVCERAQGLLSTVLGRAHAITTTWRPHAITVRGKLSAWRGKVNLAARSMEGQSAMVAHSTPNPAQLT